MNAHEAGFEFPVLALTTDKDLWGLPDLQRLTRCGRRTLRTNLQDGMELVDAEGRRWQVLSVRPVKRVGHILTRWAKDLLTGVPQFQVEHELNQLSRLTLPQVQQRVCEAMEAHPEFWCDDGYQADFPQRLAEVGRAPTIEAIHEVLGLDTFESY
ncbi:MAG: hypothetical protein JWP49_1984 [Phenylobacterium sp.]|jgi:hypothetical protein|nr:hypothetical protein [Phenylobacterium sp.]